MFVLLDFREMVGVSKRQEAMSDVPFLSFFTLPLTADNTEGDDKGEDVQVDDVEQ